MADRTWYTNVNTPMDMSASTKVIVKRERAKKESKRKGH